MDERGGSFVAVRRISQGLDRGNTCHSTSGNFHSLSFSINTIIVLIHTEVIFLFLLFELIEFWIWRLTQCMLKLRKLLLHVFGDSNLLWWVSLL